MPTQRPRGRRTAAPEKNRSRAEREIRKLQSERLKLLAALEAKVVELAETISEHMEDGVGTTEIGTWLTSPEKPNGVTRQQVYKLVSERVDRRAETSENGKPPSRPRPRPRPKR